MQRRTGRSPPPSPILSPMAQAPFSVQHFLTCLSVHWEGTPGPKTARTLEGVGYNLKMSPGMEPPFRIEELWLYARFYRLRDAIKERTFRAAMSRVATPDDGYRRKVELGKVRFTKSDGVIDVAWAIRPCIFRLAGLYEFRLQSRAKTLLGIRWKTVATDYIMIEEHR